MEEIIKYKRMRENKLERINEEESPIADIETNEAVLKAWEDKGLNKDIHTLIGGDFERIVPLDGKFVLCPGNFAVTREFIQETEEELGRFQTKNFEDKLNEVKDNLTKIILTFTFKETDFDPENPIEIKERIIKQGDKEKTIKYFAIKKPGLVLVSDGDDWWLERKEG
jgi:hypothetical protein